MSNPFGPPVDFLMLTVLQAGPAHAYAIVQLIEQLSHGKLFLQDGVVYPALHRLEAKGLVGRTWLIKDGRRTGVYELTDAGQEALSAQLEEWANLGSLVQAILDTNVPAGSAAVSPPKSAVRLPRTARSRPRSSPARPRKARICVICGKAIPPSMSEKRKTCSAECSARLRSQSNARVGLRRIRACRICGTHCPGRRIATAGPAAPSAARAYALWFRSNVILTRPASSAATRLRGVVQPEPFRRRAARSATGQLCGSATFGL